MKLGRIERRKTRSRRSEAVILFTVGPHNFAIAAQAVEEIRSNDGIVAFSHGFGRVQKVRHYLHRDGKNYFVVDANVHLHMLSSKCTRLLLLRDHPVALTAGHIERMAEITTLHPLPRAFSGEERKWYRGLALIGEDVVPVLEPAALLYGAELAALAAVLPQPVVSDDDGKKNKDLKKLAASG